MKIGVFGDSYAEKTAGNTIWFNQLATKYGHQVESFGEMGSSILFSATLIKEQAKNYDLVIWCLTNPSRFSFQVDGKQYHSFSTRIDNSVPLEVSLRQKTHVEWLKHMYNREEENFVGQAIVTHLQSLHNNILIVPCFPEPLYSKYHLYQVCETESQYYFPGIPLHKIYQKYRDLRPGHLTKANHEVLADMINNNLVPGILEIDYGKFGPPTEPLENCFQLI